MTNVRDILNNVHSLVAENNLGNAAQELQRTSSLIDGSSEAVVRGEYYYLQAAVQFSSRPHNEVLDLAGKAYSLVSDTAENLLIGRIQALLGKIYVALGDLKAGEEFIRDAISSFRRIDCDSELVLAYNKLGQVYFVRGEFKLAAKFLKQAIDLVTSDDLASDVKLMKARGNYARVQILLGQYDQAEPTLRECVQFCRDHQIPVSLAKNLLSLGYVSYLKEEYAAARQHYQEAYEIIRSEDMVRDRAIYHEYMGDLLLALGDYKMARQHYGYALEIGNRIAPKSAVVSQTERRLAELEYDCQNYAQAQEHAQLAHDVSLEIGEMVEAAAAGKILAALAARGGDHARAAKLFDEAIGVFDSCGCSREQAAALLLAGRSLIEAPKWRSLSSRYLNAAARMGRELQIERFQAECYFQLSRLEVKAGNYDAALLSLRHCETIAVRHDHAALAEECRVLRLSIEERLVDSGLSTENRFALFSSLMNSQEYGHLKSGNLEENLKILRQKTGADRAFVLAVDRNTRSFETLAADHFEREHLTKIMTGLCNGRGGSIPLDRPMFVSSVDSERSKTFDYIAGSTEPISSLISIPIELADHGVGMLYLDRIGADSVPFTHSDLYFAIAYSDIIAFKSSEEQKVRLARDNERLKNQLQQQLAFPNIVTTSREVLDILERLAQVKDSPISILIEGETGTGKDHLAKAVHYNSNRREKRFISVNCAALPETLLEAELFGHKRGAFTGAESDKVGLFEEADGGTFFLDEIGDMPLSVQVKLLRVIEEKEVVRLGETTPRKVDVRVISATNCELKRIMEEGAFRQDLYYRLSTFTFRLPPLRDRSEDIALLLQHFVNKTDSQLKIEPEAFSCLCDYNWPGNVRELENEVKKMALLAGDSRVITRQLISRRITESWSGVAAPANGERFSLYDYISRLERDYIMRALQQTNWVKKHAAETLSIPESTLRLKMKQYGISKRVA